MPLQLTTKCGNWNFPNKKLNCFPSDLYFFALNGNKIAFHMEQFFIEKWIENAFNFCNLCVTLKDHSNWVLKCYNLSKNSGLNDVLLILTVPSAFPSEYRLKGHGILAIDWEVGFLFLRNQSFHKEAHISLLRLCSHNCFFLS